MNKTEIATLANGCFWCTEAIFKQLNGVESVTPGYSGGKMSNPTYQQVSGGNTNHAESIQVVFNPKIISFETLLDVFWHTHNPTTRNQQGADVGTQYRSAIFYHNETQKKVAQQYLEKLEKEGTYDKPIVTEITKFDSFYPAEDYHKNYYESHKNAPYCKLVIEPKLKKFWEKYKH